MYRIACENCAFYVQYAENHGFCTNAIVAEAADPAFVPLGALQLVAADGACGEFEETWKGGV